MNLILVLVQHRTFFPSSTHLPTFREDILLEQTIRLQRHERCHESSHVLSALPVPTAPDNDDQYSHWHRALQLPCEGKVQLRSRLIGT